MAGLMAYEPIPKTATRANTAVRCGEGLFQASGGLTQPRSPLVLHVFGMRGDHLRMEPAVPGSQIGCQFCRPHQL